MASQNRSFISVVRCLHLSRQAHNTKRGTRYYSLINIKINVYFVAIRFSRRRFRYHMDYMDPLVLLWKQTSTSPPSDLLFVISKRYTCRTVKFDSEMAVARLRYLSTNCTLTFGSSNCRLLIFFPEWNQWDFSWGRLEKRRTRHFESKVKPIYGTLPSCDVFSVLHLNCIIFRQICALTPNILFPSPPTQRSSWLMRSVFAIRRHASRL